jgi:hypothetical protein
MQETDRAEAQETADSLKGAEERNKLGQFSTPFLLADQMVKRALSFLDPATPLRFHRFCCRMIVQDIVENLV